jgi:cholesterol transport system auxiliary component
MNVLKAFCSARQGLRLVRVNPVSLHQQDKYSMKKLAEIVAATLAVTAIVLSVGCTAAKTEAILLYDFGPLRASQVASVPGVSLPPLSIAEVSAPAWLDSPMIFFRLAYANEQQPRPYANSRWTMPPAQLFGQRLKARLAQAGGIVLAATDGAANVLLLRVEADDFTQTFESQAQSSAQIAVRASVFNGRALLAQKSFAYKVGAPSADAAGAAKALAGAGDAVIADMTTWLASLPVRKN